MDLEDNAHIDYRTAPSMKFYGRNRFIEDFRRILFNKCNDKPSPHVLITGGISVGKSSMVRKLTDDALLFSEKKDSTSSIKHIAALQISIADLVLETQYESQLARLFGFILSSKGRMSQKAREYIKFFDSIIVGPVTIKGMPKKSQSLNSLIKDIETAFCPKEKQVLVIVLDDFQKFFSPNNRELDLMYEVLRVTSGQSRRLLLIFTLPEGKFKNYFAGKHDLFRKGILKKFPLEPFSYGEAKDFIRQFASENGYILSSNLASWIIEKSNGNPHYIQKIVGSLIEKVDSKQLTTENTRKVCKKLLADIDRTFHEPLYNLCNVQRKNVLHELAFVSESTFDDLAENLRNPGLSSDIEELVEEGIITMEGNLIRIWHPLFQEYVQEMVRSKQKPSVLFQKFLRQIKTSISDYETFSLSNRKIKEHFSRNKVTTHQIERLLSLQEYLSLNASDKGFVDYSETVRDILPTDASPSIVSRFVENVNDGCQKLMIHYSKNDQSEYAVGSYLEALLLTYNLDEEEVYLRKLEKVSRTHKELSRDTGKTLIPGHPHDFCYILPLLKWQNTKKYIYTLSYLIRNLWKNYPGLEAIRLILDSGIGPHRAEVKRFLKMIESELHEFGCLHQGCIVCTSVAVEVLHAAGRWNGETTVKTLEWLEGQRGSKWMRMRNANYGYNFPASAMKALYVAGRYSSAREISEVLLSGMKTDKEKGYSYWSGTDIEDHVATGRVLESLHFCKFLPRDVAESARSFIEAKLKNFHPRRTIREYDAWSLIGYLSCEDNTKINPKMTKILQGIIAPDFWENNGSWTQNSYRTAMFGRVILTALTRDVNLSIEGVDTS